ncbi:MAG TPA: hypothetical protein VJ793_24095 [Anaerolineae bacterium]|nr:hypothetical protein [Anaerolineae bacterium]
MRRLRFAPQYGHVTCEPTSRPHDGQKDKSGLQGLDVAGGQAISGWDRLQGCERKYNQMGRARKWPSSGKCIGRGMLFAATAGSHRTGRSIPVIPRYRLLAFAEFLDGLSTADEEDV